MSWSGTCQYPRYRRWSYPTGQHRWRTLSQFCTRWRRLHPRSTSSPRCSRRQAVRRSHRSCKLARWPCPACRLGPSPAPGVRRVNRRRRSPVLCWGRAHPSQWSWTCWRSLRGGCTSGYCWSQNHNRWQQLQVQKNILKMMYVMQQRYLYNSLIHDKPPTKILTIWRDRRPLSWIAQYHASNPTSVNFSAFTSSSFQN